MTAPAIRAASLGILLLGLAAAPAFSSEDEYGVLADAPGVEETYNTCIACHSEMIVAQQGLSRQHWQDLLEWMVKEQGMIELEPRELAIVLDYLSTNYREDRPNFPRK
jgi:cytochrome c